MSFNTQAIQGLNSLSLSLSLKNSYLITSLPWTEPLQDLVVVGLIWLPRSGGRAAKFSYSRLNLDGGDGRGSEEGWGKWV